MNRIELENMEFYAYHGCFEKEKIVGGRFVVSVWLDYDATLAAKTDDLAHTLNYQRAYEMIAKEMQQTSNLLEHVAGRLLDMLYENFPKIEQAKVKVSKMNPPMGGQIGSVSLTMKR